MSWLLFGFKVHASRAVVGTQIKGKTADVILGPPKESAFEREWGKLRRATQYLTFLLGGC